MKADTVEILGTVREDGTLILDGKLDLPPGRVKVIVNPTLDLSQTDVWQLLERIWAGQRARGHVPRTHEEIEAELEATRQEDEERLRSLEQIQEEGYRRRYPQAPASTE